MDLKWKNIKGKEIAIHCSTQELADEVNNFIIAHGGRNLAKEWINYGTSTCYDLDFPYNCYCNKKYYVKDNIQIVSAEEFLAANGGNYFTFNFLIL